MLEQIKQFSLPGCIRRGKKRGDHTGQQAKDYRLVTSMHYSGTVCLCVNRQCL